MNPRVLAEAKLFPDHFETATLEGFEIVIRPLANLVPSDHGRAYGLLTVATHAELERLYAHARDILGGTYVPHPVVVRTADGRSVPALCYIASHLEPKPAANDYIDRIVGPARQHSFPASYIEHLESFRS